MSLDEKEINKEFYIDDIDLTSPIANCTDLSSLILALEHIEERVTRVERAISLSKGRIFKATPLLSLIYNDKLAKRRIDHVYQNWISYMNHLARNNLNGLSINQTFWNIDSFIFENFFYNLFTVNNVKISFIPLSTHQPLENQYTGNFLDIVRIALGKTRNPDYSLARPKEKEYISSFVEYSNNTIYVLYFPEELKDILGQQSPRIVVNEDLQLNHHHSSLSHNIVGDGNIIRIKSGENKQIETIEKGVLSGDIFYNTIIDANLINAFDHNLYSIGEAQLNVTMILYHAMLHLKIDLSKPNNTDLGHGRSFINEFINFTPSVLYGHFTWPTLTVN